MSGDNGVPVPASAIGMHEGALPDARVVRASLRAHWPSIRLGERRPLQDLTAERSLVFLDGPDRVGAAHFPWTLSVPGVAMPEHASHIWLSVRNYDRERRTEALRLLARATTAMIRATRGDFVWWSVGDKIMAPAVFAASTEREA